MKNYIRRLSSFHSSIQLRPYQRECIEASLTAFKKGIKRQVVSLPVGSGKTVVFANLINQLPNTGEASKVLVMAHREELLNQAFRQISHFCPDLRVAFEQGSRNANVVDADVIIASVQTLSRVNSKRLLKYDPRMFKCIIIDEAHHSSASTYLKVLDHFNAIPHFALGLFCHCHEA